MNKETNTFLSVCVYVYNRWSLDESLLIFGGSVNDPYCLGMYMWNKWEKVNGDLLRFAAELDSDNLDKFVMRAVECYDGRSSRM